MYKRVNPNRVRLLISCQERPGVISAVSNCICSHQANIVKFDQHTTDPKNGMLFMRIEFDMEDYDLSFQLFKENFPLLAEDYSMEWTLNSERTIKRMGLFVSKMDHCLMELLWRWKSKEFLVDIPMVISNHPDLKATVEDFGIPFYHIPVTPDTKEEAERRALEILKDRVNFIVLARYMQVLSPSFIENYPNQIINIHHSFLPAFVGANPYEKAFQRGVKLIGATAHYVTNDLDEGPIIQQDVLRVHHGYTAEELKVAGRHVERTVLAQAVSWHLDDKVIVDGNKTITFV